MPLDVLAISPHPDDLELGSGGLIAKLTDDGYDVGIIDLTRGEKGTYGTGETRVEESKAAAEALGAKVRENMDLGDCRLNYSFEAGKKLADRIREYEPSIIIAPYGDDSHPDHEAGRKFADKSAFLAKLRKVDTGHDAHKVNGFLYFMTHLEFEPTLIVDVSDYYKKKEEAFKAYESQAKLMEDQGGLLNLVRLRDRRYGVDISAEYGEPFYSSGPLPVENPVVFWE